jgi:hypothetical protein
MMYNWGTQSIAPPSDPEHVEVKVLRDNRIAIVEVRTGEPLQYVVTPASADKDRYEKLLKSLRDTWNVTLEQLAQEHRR